MIIDNNSIISYRFESQKFMSKNIININIQCTKLYPQYRLQK